MPGSRTIPAVTGVARVRIRIDDVDMPVSLPLLAMEVRLEVNRISFARLILQDAVATDNGLVRLSNTQEWAPGKLIEILCGTADMQQTLFQGIIVHHKVRVRTQSAVQFIVECRHPLYRATLVRHRRVFTDITDTEMMQQQIDTYGLPSPSVMEASAHRHRQLVQGYCTDWDFWMLRAQANGLVFMLQPDQVEVVRPVPDATPAHTLTYGASIIELDAEIDGRLQPSAVKAESWDLAALSTQQEQGNAADTGMGNLQADAIAGALQHEEEIMWHGGALDGAELHAWADARASVAKLGKIRGRVKVEGINDFRLGDTVRLNDTGERYDGIGWISGIMHSYDNREGWKTQLQLGGMGNWWPAEQPGLHAEPAAALVAAIPGLQVGIVEALEGDPDNAFRVQVRIPALSSQNEALWARMVMPDAGDNRGFFMRPEIGDEVLVGFLHSDPRHPVILGCLHGPAKPAPVNPADTNAEKGYYSRSGFKWVIDDAEKSFTLKTPGGQKVVLKDGSGSITLSDAHQNKIEMNATGIRIQSPAKLELSAAQLVLGGSGSVSVQASGNLEMEGGGGTTLRASGVVTIQGALVNIN